MKFHCILGDLQPPNLAEKVAGPAAADQQDGVDPFVEYRSLGKKDWQSQDEYEKDQHRTGNGEQGSGVKIEAEGNQTLAKIMVSKENRNLRNLI